MAHRSLLVCSLTIALAAGCGDPAPAANPAAEQAAENAKAIVDLRDAVRDLRAEIRRQDRRLAGVGDDVASMALEAPAGAAPAEAVSGTPSVAAAGADVPPSEGLAVGEAAVRALLETDAGRQAIEKAAARELARRQDEERRTFVSYTVGVFAQSVGLDETRTSELQRIWKDSLDAGSTLRERFSSLRALPEADQPAAREKAMEFMRDIGRKRNEEIRLLLSEEQYARYGDTEKEILGSLHGGPRTAPARPAARE